MLAPMAPFIAEELWREVLSNDESVHLASWPDFDPSLTTRDRVVLVVQVNGKVRDKIDVDASAGEEECRELALASEKALRSIGESEVRKVIVRAPKLVNIVAN